MKNFPYIGITGFMNDGSADRIFVDFKQRRPLSKSAPEGDRILMIGVLASLKTFYGELNKYPNRYPAIKEINEIFICSPSNVLNLIQYNTGYTETLYPQMVALTEMASNMDGFQLNIAWPDEDQLRAYKKHYPDKIIVLQVGRKALDMAKKVLGLKTCLTGYKGLIDYVLFDPSGGKGEPFDVLEILPCLRVARNVFGKSVGLGVAGGLSSKTLGVLNPVIKEFPDISIDAEGRLRDSNDHLSVVGAELYIEKAFEVLKKGGR